MIKPIFKKDVNNPDATVLSELRKEFSHINGIVQGKVKNLFSVYTKQIYLIMVGIIILSVIINIGFFINKKSSKVVDNKNIGGLRNKIVEGVKKDYKGEDIQNYVQILAIEEKIKTILSKKDKSHEDSLYVVQAGQEIEELANKRSHSIKDTSNETYKKLKERKSILTKEINERLIKKEKSREDTLFLVQAYQELKKITAP